MIASLSVFGQNVKWGWNMHRYINEHAVDYLPAEMSFFQDQRQYLKDHSTDPDGGPLPGFYHYIDIDYYPEFFTGTLPHNWDDMVALYGLSTVEDNGIVPWVVEWWTDSLSALMGSGQWDDVWQVAAELGHYVADSHQPLHLTLNYNGYLTGNDGIHSRYESYMINAHLTQIPLPTGDAENWDSVIDSVFLYIDNIYLYVDSIMVADDLAYAQDPSYDSTYYSILWQELEHLTTVSIQTAILDLASIWRTAWINAGSPLTTVTEDVEEIPCENLLVNAYPNPFNPQVTIQVKLDYRKYTNINIFDITGKKITELYSGWLNSGDYKFKWDISQSNSASSGTYFVKINTDKNSQTLKLICLK